MAVAVLHLLLGLGLLLIAAKLRFVPPAFLFLVVGAYFAILGIGMLRRKPWAWWSAIFLHPLLLLGELIGIPAGIFLIKNSWHAPDLGKLGVVLGALLLCAVFCGLALSVSTLVRLWKPSVRETFFAGAESETALPANRWR